MRKGGDNGWDASRQTHYGAFRGLTQETREERLSLVILSRRQCFLNWKGWSLTRFLRAPYVYLQEKGSCCRADCFPAILGL